MGLGRFKEVVREAEATRVSEQIQRKRLLGAPGMCFLRSLETINVNYVKGHDDKNRKQE